MTIDRVVNVGMSGTRYPASTALEMICKNPYRYQVQSQIRDAEQNLAFITLVDQEGGQVTRVKGKSGRYARYGLV